MTNGCSFTEGVYDNFNKSDSWPYQLQRKYDCDLDQLAKGGGSNARIFRTTIEYLLDNDPDMVVIGWTQHERYELPYHDGDMIRIMHSMALPEREAFGDIVEMREFYYKNCYNNLTLLYQTVYYIRTVQRMLEDRDIHYLMFNALENDYLHQFEDDNHPITKQMQPPYMGIDKINNDKWLMWGSSMEQYLETYPKADDYGHPDIEGHTVWTDLIYKDLNAKSENYSKR